MKLLNNLRFYLLLLPVLGLAQEINYSSKIPFDADVKKGVLKNGLTYYIKKNGKPEKKVDLRLVINAGSILEDDDQQGLAHFMEHMCFNGTKRFPKNQLVDYLQSIGVKFGQHLNAYTSFDETVYFLPIPSDNPEKLEKGFQIIEDWAFNTILSPEEINKERGVVLEEYRIGLGAGKRMMGKILPKMMYNSQYAKRLPIGQKDILENFKHESLIRFYKDWYRPNLMSVIVVGDINVAEMEKKIISHFSNYQNPKNERPRKTFEVPNHKETFVVIESDKEASSAQVQLIYKDQGSKKNTVTVGDFKDDIVEGLFATMLNTRLDELTNSATPPFTYGYSYHGGTYARTKEAYQSIAMCEETKQVDALKVLVSENARAAKFGFNQGELDRAKADFLANIERSFNDRTKTASENFVQEFQTHFLDREPAPGIKWTFETMKKVVPTIKLEDVNGYIKQYTSEENRVVILTGPEKEGLKKPTESDLLNALNVNLSTLTPYEDKAVATSLLRNPSPAGTIVSRSNNEKLGTKSFILSNGAKVTFKKTDFKNDEILFEAISFGGSNLYSNDDMKKVQFANGALAEAGFSGLKLNDINKFMTGKIANVNPYIGGTTEGLRGSTTPKDLEYLFQMTHAYFTDLNLDKDAFDGYKQKQSSFFNNMAAQPTFFFQQEMQTMLNKENPRFNGVIPTEKTWATTDYNLAYTKYKERFANAADFEFFFVGNVDEKIIENLASIYLAGLPGNATREKAVDTGVRMLKGEHKKIVNKGKDPKSTVSIMFIGETAYTMKEAIAIQALGEVLTIKLVEQLRENESGVYGVGARGSMSKVPYGSFSFNISFPCGPENAEKLIVSALNEVEKVIANGPDEKDLIKFKEGELADFRKESKENRYWLSNFTRSFINGSNPQDILDFEAKVNALTVKELQEVAKKYLTKEKIVGILMPEKA